MLPEALKDYDIGVAIDSSGSMSRPAIGNVSRWKAAHEGTFAIASKAAEYDSDGIDVYTFGGRVKAYRGVTPDKVDQVWQENEPNGGTPLHLVIREARQTWEASKKAGTTKKGYILAVVTDGVPDDQRAVEQEIISLANSLGEDGEFGIQLLQVGNDAEATKYLKSLDDDLKGKGAKFDIVDTKTFEEMGDRPLAQTFLDAILD